MSPGKSLALAVFGAAVLHVFRARTLARATANGLTEPACSGSESMDTNDTLAADDVGMAEPSGRTLLEAEYKSLRDESSQARQAQQSTIAWSLAAFATVFAGGLVFVSNAFTSGTAVNAITIAFYALVFGAALPGFIFAGCMTYLGELIRMERAGGYLRGLERHLAVTAKDAGHSLGAPLRWETYLVQKAQEDGVSKQKQRIGYVGGAALYAGAEIISLAAFIAGSESYTFEEHDVGWDQAAIAWAVVLLLVFFATTLWAGWGILSSGKKNASYSQIDPILLP